MDKQTCPRCQTVNDSGAGVCSKCSLDLGLFDYIIACLTGDIPLIESKMILEPGELAYFDSEVSMLAQKTETLVKHNFLGTRVRLGGMPIYFGQSSPQKESSEVLVDAGSGEFTLTNRRIVVVSDKQTFSVPLSKIVDFEHYGSGVQIFVDGKHSGIIYQVINPWQLWILLFALLKAKGLKPSTEAEKREVNEFVLHIISETKSVQKASERAEWIETVFYSAPATCIWLILCPPIGLWSLWKSDFSMFHKAIWAIVGLYSLGKWSLLFQQITG